MVRKRIIMSAGIVTAVCLFGACASKSSEEPNWQTTEQNQVIESEKTDEQTTEQNQVTEAKKADDHVTTNVENLTENTSQGICIDYAIISYEDVQNFGYELFAQNIQGNNPVLSPVSAYIALSMAGCGTDGATCDEFCSVLGDMEVFSDDMMNNLPQDGEQQKLSIANSVWIDDEFIVDDMWLGTIKSLMDAEAFQADLSTEEAMNGMNSWIANHTNGMIDKMIDVPLDTWTRLALFDTIYFKGKWQTPFEAQNTHQEDFYIDQARNRTEQVDMMNLYETNLDYIANDFAEGVILPYQKNDDSSCENLVFVALKPIGNENIREVYDKLTNEVIMDILVNKQTELVNLKLPKFEITFDKELNECLSNMGLVECFDVERANFDRMGKTQSGDNLYISLVHQKAKIIVDEEGTEAAAVTEVIMACGAAIVEPQNPKEVYFNEPFVYMIMNLDKELPLFIGILDNPVS